jgi:hypothetical protein
MSGPLSWGANRSHFNISKGDSDGNLVGSWEAVETSKIGGGVEVVVSTGNYSFVLWGENFGNTAVLMCPSLDFEEPYQLRRVTR